MKEVYEIANGFYPMDNFPYPTVSYQQKEIIAKTTQDAEGEVFEEMTILRNPKGEIVKMTLIADFGDYRDEVVMERQDDKTLLVFGNYDNPMEEEE